MLCERKMNKKQRKWINSEKAKLRKIWHWLAGPAATNLLIR